MKIKYLSVLIAILSFFTACKKNSESATTDTFPHKVYFSSATAKGSARVFANGAEITDQTIINRFASAAEKVSMLRRLPGDTTTITFITADKAYFNANGYTVTKTGSQLNLSLTRYGFPDASNDIIFGLYAHPPAITTIGNSIQIDESLVATGDYTTVTLPFTGYKLVRKTLSLTQYSQFYDSFNAQVATKLGLKDTVAIQEYTIVYKAR